MSYAYNNLKITFGGNVYGESDEWSNSFHAGFENQDFNNGLDVFDYQVLVNDLAPKNEEWLTALNRNISQHANLKWVKIALLDKQGLYLEGPWIYDFVTPPVGAYTLPVAPQLSVVQSMSTNVKRGPARFGRIYPPLTGVPNSAGVDNAGMYRVETFRDLVEGMNGSVDEAFPGITGKPTIIIASKVGTGRNATVTEVRVGQVIDTMRSRRNKFVENYSVLEIR